MKTLDLMLTLPMMEALGWTLIHFLWQGTLVALLLANILKLLPRRAASLRYCIACVAMLLMLSLPPITMWVIGSSSSNAATTRSTAIQSAPTELRQLSTLANSQPDSAMAVSKSPLTKTWQQQLDQRILPYLPWMISAWLIGVLLLSLRLVTGWLYTQRLRKRGTRPLTESWQAVLRRLCEQLRIARPVRLCESVWVQVPTAIGWLRPVILLPASALAGLTPQQLESIIVHELAHIRRYDYLINLLQAVIETLFFYHPAVWWVSRQIRQERESCCDDLAVAVCGDALVYARALVEMEQLRADVPQLAVAANGGLLMNRIHRLVGVQAQATNRFTGLLASVIVVTAVVSLAIGAPMLLPSPRTSAAQQIEPAAAPETKSESAKASEALREVNKNRSESSTEAQRKPVADQANVVPAQVMNDQTTAAQSLKSLSSSDATERAAAACSLGHLSAVDAIPALINLLGDDAPIEPIKCWQSGNWSPAMDTLKRPSPGEQAAIALAALGKPAVEPLITALSNTNPSVRRNAAWAIGEVTGVSTSGRSAAVEPLINALHDADAWVRLAAAFSLGELRPRRATESLIAALTDSEWSVREMVVRALGEMKSRAGVERLTAVLLQDGDERVRRKAAWALGEIKDRLALEALTAALSDRDQGVRRTAKWAISEIQD